MSQDVLNGIERELKKLCNTKFILYSIIFIPIIACFVIFLTFSKGTLHGIPVGILDLDNSNISKMISRAVNSTPAACVKYKLQNTNEGLNLIKKGDIQAFIVIPKDFKRDLNRQKRPKIVYYYNNETILISSLVTKDIQTAAITAAKALDAKVKMKRGLAKKNAIQSVNLIKVDEKVISNPYMNYSYFLSYASIAHVFQVMIALIMVCVFGIEFREGTAKEWLKENNDSIIKAVLSKIIPYHIIFLFEMIVVTSLYVLLWGAPFNSNILFLIFSTSIFILCYQLSAMAFVAITSNMRLSVSSAAFYTSLGFTFAGMTYPAFAMPLFAKMYSAALPIRPFVAILVNQTMRGLNFKYDLIYVLWLLILASISFLTIFILKKHVHNEDLWYKI